MTGGQSWFSGSASLKISIFSKKDGQTNLRTAYQEIAELLPAAFWKWAIRLPVVDISRLQCPMVDSLAIVPFYYSVEKGAF